MEKNIKDYLDAVDDVFLGVIKAVTDEAGSLSEGIKGLLGRSMSLNKTRNYKSIIPRSNAKKAQKLERKINKISREIGERVLEITAKKDGGDIISSQAIQKFIKEMKYYKDKLKGLESETEK